MTLLQVLNKINQDAASASQPCDMVIGTVTAVSPLEITIDATQAPLREIVLVLTDCVKEKKIDIPDVGEVVIQSALAAGDKVVMLRVLKGQTYLVLSKIGGTS